MTASSLPQSPLAAALQNTAMGAQAFSSQPVGQPNFGGSRQLSPLYRQRAEAFNESLPATVDACLKTYFKDLNGMSPAAGMYVKVISQVEKPLIEHVLRYVRINQVRAASILGINRNTLRKKIQALNIDLDKLMSDVGH